MTLNFSRGTKVIIHTDEAMSGDIMRLPPPEAIIPITTEAIKAIKGKGSRQTPQTATINPSNQSVSYVRSHAI